MNYNDIDRMGKREVVGRKRERGERRERVFGGERRKKHLVGRKL